MTHKSTIDRIRSLVDDIVSSYNPDDAASAAREVRALLDTLVPPNAANPIDAALVALDYGTDRDWPADAVALVARLLPEMKIATAWIPCYTAAGVRCWERLDVAGVRVVGAVEAYDGAKYHASTPGLPKIDGLPSGVWRRTREEAQAIVDAALLPRWTLMGGAVVAPTHVTGVLTSLNITDANGDTIQAPLRSVLPVEGQPGAVSVEYGPVDISNLLGRSERFAVYQRHDWPLRGEGCVCRRCGLIRERRGNAHIYHEGDARWRRPAGECRIQVEPKPQEQV